MNTLKYVVVIVIPFVAVVIRYQPFWEISLDVVETENVDLISNKVSDQFMSKLIFVL